MVTKETSKNLLEIEDLTLKFYTYAGAVEALDEVSLSVHEGETLGIVGETGCGKSVTSLAVLVLVPNPGRIESGTIKFKHGTAGIDLLKADENALRRIRGKDISMVFQEPRAYLNPVYTVKDQIAEVLLQHRRQELIQRVLDRLEIDIAERDKRERERKEAKKKKIKIKVQKVKMDKGEKFPSNYFFQRRTYRAMLKNPKSIRLRIMGQIPLLNKYKKRFAWEVDKEVNGILKEMEMADPRRVADAYPHELSGGMAQRVVIAMALACNPTLLIADEPTTNLDVTVQLQILSLIRTLKKKFGSSIVYITHDLGVVAELCERVAVMYAGVVCEIAEVVELFKNPFHPYTKALLQSIPSPDHELRWIEGTVPSLINPPEGCRFHTRCKYALDICSNVKPKLVEVKPGHYATCHLYGGSKNE